MKTFNYHSAKDVKEAIQELKKEFNSLHPTLGTIPYYRNYFTNKSIVNFSSKKIKRKK